MIRLGISFDILWTDMRIFSCNVTRRSYDRSSEKEYIESRSFIILHDEHLDDIVDCILNHWWYHILKAYHSLFSVWMTICIILHAYFTNWQYYDIIHWQSFIRHEIRKYQMIILIIDINILFLQLLVCRFSEKYGSGQTMDQHTFNSSLLILIVSIRVAFFAVSSWILSIDYDWFSRLRTIL